MSLRPNRYRLAIGARIELTLPGLTPQPRPIRSMPFPRDPGECLTAFDKMLEGLARSKLARLDSLEAVLGFPHARHLVLPWQDAIVAPADRRMYAQAMAAEEHGVLPERQNDWHCLLTQESFGQACIASAVCGKLVEAIALSAKNHGLRLRPLRTLLEETVARHPGPLPRDAVFMAAGLQACEFAFRRNGQWQQAFGLRRGQNGLQTDAECLRSAALLARHFPPSVHAGGHDLFEGGRAV